MSNGSIEDQLQAEWQSRPVEPSDLDSILKLIEESWKQAVELLGPACLQIPNGTAAYGPLSFAFGSALGMRCGASLYQAHIDNLAILPRELANLYCFTAIRSGLDDERRSRGLYFLKLEQILAIEDGSADEIKAAVQNALDAGREAEGMVKLFNQGLERLWKQFYMPETLAQSE